jgi:hypothetical protein
MEEDAFPDKEGQTELVSWVEKKFNQAEQGKAAHKDKWEKFYLMYRSYVEKRKTGDWRSRAWMPVAFYVIETVLPKLIAQLPVPVVNPVGPEDVQPAETMEDLLEWAKDKSGLYLELTKALKSALIYGTGILKTQYKEETAYMITREPVMEESFAQMPMLDQAGMPMTDMDGMPMMQEVSQGATPKLDADGQPVMETVRKPYTSYAGPVAEAVDIDNFFPDPVGDSIGSCRYVIHRVYRDRAHLERMFESGAYHRPDPAEMEALANRVAQEHAMLDRQSLAELGPGGMPEAEMGLYPILEVWTDEWLVATLGERGGILLRCERNPFAHGQKPFVRLVDHLVPHEFWGIGELEPLEGLQDVLNALWNSRIDNVKLVMNTMLTAVMDYVEDPADLTWRPGGVVRLREGMAANQAIAKLEIGDVTASSYEEANEIERMTEKVSGVNPMTEGQEAAPYQRTATGLSMATEAANSRFSHKLKMAELTGFVHLFQQYASILQQFMPDELVIRIEGEKSQVMQPVVDPATGQPAIDPMTGQPMMQPDPMAGFKRIDQGSVVGRFDFDIESESSAQTESMRKENEQSLFQLLFQDPYIKPLPLRRNIVRQMGHKDVDTYVMTDEELQMAMAQQQAQAEAEAQQMAEQGPPQEDSGAPES